MRKFKHRTTGYIATETNSEKNYKVSEPKNFTIPKWIVEDSEDWEEVKDEFPKIISFRNTTNDVIFHICEDGFYTSCSLAYKIGTFNKEHFLEESHYEIYQVAISETEVFTLGDKVKHPFTEGFDVVSKFIICKDPKRDVVWTIDRPDLIGKLVANVGNYFGNCNIEASKLEKASEVLFVTEDGIEIYEGDLCYLIYLPLTDKSKIEFESRFRKELLPNPSYRLIFATKEAAEKYIDENKPIYSKKQVKDALNNTFIGTLDGIYIYAEIFKRNLGL